MKWLALILALGALTFSAAAQTADPALSAQRAAQLLERAALAMAEAEDARDRVDALTETIRAYEDGLAALREGMRRAAIREQSITVVFEAEQERLGRLLGVLQSMQAAPAPLLLIHPNGPVGTARSGMIVSDITPAVAEEALELRGFTETQRRNFQNEVEGFLPDLCMDEGGVEADLTACRDSIEDFVSDWAYNRFHNTHSDDARRGLVESTVNHFCGNQ